MKRESNAEGKWNKHFNASNQSSMVSIHIHSGSQVVSLKKWNPGPLTC